MDTVDKMKEEADRIRKEFLGDGSEPKSTPKFMNDPDVQKNMSSDIREEANSKSEKYGLFGQMKAWGAATFETFQDALVGKKKRKKGIIESLTEKSQSVMSSFTEWLLGGGKYHKYGFLAKISVPIRENLEQAKHHLTKNLSIPMWHAGKVFKESAKWFVRDIKYKFQDITRGIGSWLENMKEKKPGSLGSKVAGKILDVTRGAKNIAKKAVGGVTALPGKLAYGMAQKQQKQLLIQGKISQAQYDKWNNEYSASMDSEDARHTESMKDISNLKEKINLDRVKDPKLREKAEAFEQQMAEMSDKEKNMTKEERKEEEQRVKKQQKINKEKLARGEAISEDDQMGALSTRQRMDYMRDNMKEGIEAEHKRQIDSMENDKFDLQKQATEFAGKTADVVTDIFDFITGKKKKEEFDKAPPPKDDSKASQENENIIKRDQTKDDIKQTDRKADIEQNKPSDKEIDDKKEGSMRHQQEMDSKKLANDANEASSKHLKAIADGTKTTASAYKKGGIMSKLVDGLKNLGKGAFDLIKKVAILGAGIAAVGASVAIGGAFVKKGQKIGTAFKDKGLLGAASELTGIGKDLSSSYDDNGKEKSGVDKVTDNFKIGRFVKGGGIQKTAKMFAWGVKKITPKMIQSVAKGGGNLAMKGGKALLNSNVLKSGAKGVSKFGTKVTLMLTKMLSHPKIIKFIGQTGVTQLVEKLSKSLVGKLAKSGAKSAFKFLAGPAMAAFWVYDFVSGMNEANRYFAVGKNDKPTLGMKVTAGLCKMLINNLLFGLVPIDFVCKIVYDYLGFLLDGKDGKSKLSEKKAALEERAKLLGVDPKKLNELENKMTGTSIGDTFKSQKSKDARDAKMMGMTLEEYQEFKKKNQDIVADQEQKKKGQPTKAELETQKKISVSQTSNENKAKDIKKYGSTGWGEVDPTYDQNDEISQHNKEKEKEQLAKQQVEDQKMAKLTNNEITKEDGDKYNLDPMQYAFKQKKDQVNQTYAKAKQDVSNVVAFTKDTTNKIKNQKEIQMVSEIIASKLQKQNSKFANSQDKSGTRDDQTNSENYHDSKIKKVGDGVIYKDGKVTKFDDKDNIIATKKNVIIKQAKDSGAISRTENTLKNNKEKLSSIIQKTNKKQNTTAQVISSPVQDNNLKNDKNIKQALEDNVVVSAIYDANTKTVDELKNITALLAQIVENTGNLGKDFKPLGKFFKKQLEADNKQSAWDKYVGNHIQNFVGLFKGGDKTTSGGDKANSDNDYKIKS